MFYAIQNISSVPLEILQCRGFGFQQSEFAAHFGQFLNLPHSSVTKFLRELNDNSRLSGNVPDVTGLLEVESL